MNRTHDPARVKLLQAAADRFPPHYLTLILAEALPIAERLDTLEAAVQRYRDFDLVWYRFAEELFHRGPLAGRLRVEAGEAFHRTVGLRPNFAPAWYHLAGLAITDGDSVGADSALAKFERLEGYSTGVPFAQLGLLVAAKAWRFGGGEAGPAITTQIISDPRVPNELLAAGPRLFLAARAWDGALWLGREFEGRSSVQLVRAGLIAQSLAHIAQGRPDSSARTAVRLESAVADDATRVFAAGLPAVLALVSSDSLDPSAVAPYLARLRRFLDPGASGSGARRAAGFLLGALAIASDQPAVLREAERGLGTDRLGLGFRALLGSLAAHRRGDTAASAGSILFHGVGLLQDQPAARAVGQFWEARSLARAGSADAAVRKLRWVEHEDVIGLPTERPLAAELEWALGPLARFEESRILDRAGIDRARLCRLLAGTRHDWQNGTAVFAERARRARERYAVLSCGPAA
jgi:hypothetical protein